MDLIIVNLVGVLLILAIIWWFWLATPQTAFKAQREYIDINVDGGVYDPSVIEASPGQTLKLRFHRQDPNVCAEYVIFNDFGISEQLPINQPHTITLQLPKKTGQYEFTCQMSMYRGVIKIT